MDSLQLRVEYKTVEARDEESPTGFVRLEQGPSSAILLTPNEIDPEIPPALSSLVMDCIEPEPNQRPRKMDQVIDRLEIAGAQLARGNGKARVSKDAPKRHAG